MSLPLFFSGLPPSLSPSDPSLSPSLPPSICSSPSIPLHPSPFLLSSPSYPPRSFWLSAAFVCSVCVCVCVLATYMYCSSFNVNHLLHWVYLFAGLDHWTGLLDWPDLISVRCCTQTYYCIGSWLWPPENEIHTETMHVLVQLTATASWKMRDSWAEPYNIVRTYFMFLAEVCSSKFNPLRILIRSSTYGYVIRTEWVVRAARRRCSALADRARVGLGILGCGLCEGSSSTNHFL